MIDRMLFKRYNSAIKMKGKRWRMGRGGNRQTPEQYAAPRNSRNGSKLAMIRLRRGITQKQLAMMAGVTPAQISNFETNTMTPRVSTIKKIADVLGVDWTDIVE